MNQDADHTDIEGVFEMMGVPPSGDWGAGAPVSPRKSGSDLETRQTVAELQLKLERQHLLLQTLLRLLMEKGLIQEAEFKQWLEFVDGFDGTLDGKLRGGKEPQTCPSCGRKSPPGYVRCQYCAADFPQEFLEPDRRKS